MILLNNLKMFFLAFAVLFTNTLYAYPPQAELFGLNKSMVQLWVSYPNGVTGTGLISLSIMRMNALMAGNKKTNNRK